MAKQSGLAQEFHIAGFDLSGDVSSVDVGVTRNLLDATAINVSAHERTLGLEDSAITFNVFFNDAALHSHAALSTLPTTDVQVQYLTGVAPGDPAFIMTGKQVNYDWSRSADGGLIGTVEVRGDADSPSGEWGRVVCPKTTHATADETAIWDAGAASAAGCTAQLQAFSNTGDDVVYILQDDTAANMATAATYISFGTITTAAHPTTVRKEESDACNRYRRVATTGTFTNAIFAVAMREGATEDEEAYSG